MLPSVQIGLGSLRVNPLRTALSTLGVVVGVGAMVSVLAIGDGVERAMRAEVARDGRLLRLSLAPVTTETVDGQTLPRTDYPTFAPADAADLARRLDGLARVRLVQAGAALVRPAADGDDPGTVGAAGATERRAALVTAVWQTAALPGPQGPASALPLLAGRPLAPAEIAAGEALAVVSRDLAALVAGGAPAGAVGRTVRLGDAELRVVGVLRPDSGAAAAADRRQSAAASPKPAGRYAALVPFAAGARALARPSGAPRASPPSVVVTATRIENLPAARDAAREWLAARFGAWEGRVRLASYEQEGEQLGRAILVFKLLMGSITGISLVVGGIGIMNVLLASVVERTREIGVRKATGARNRDVLVQFLAESVAVSGAGSAAGVALGMGVAAAVAALMRERATIPVYATLGAGTLGVVLLAALTVGLAFGIYPALRAARLSPIDAIRHE